MDVLFTEKQAAEWLGLQPRTLSLWRRTRSDAVPFVRLSARAIRYRKSDLEAFAESRLRRSTNDSGRDAE